MNVENVVIQCLIDGVAVYVRVTDQGLEWVHPLFADADEAPFDTNEALNAIRLTLLKGLGI